MKWWADWMADNPRDHARPPGLTEIELKYGIHSWDDSNLNTV
jgi:hypothetical protein